MKPLLRATPTRRITAITLGIVMLGFLSGNLSCLGESLSPRLKPHLLPGHSSFAFSLYGVPADVGQLKRIVQVMREQHLGNAFDPGPTPGTASREVYEYLATVGWPVVCYPGCADMQIQGGRCVMGPDHLKALEPMDRAGLFTAVQLGEWGYYLHNLSPDERWWRDVYGKEFDQFKHLMKPKGLAGYDRRPQSRAECYEVVKNYFLSRKRDLLDRIISVTGHSHYEAYAGGWGARCIGLEIGENIAFTQSKFAFARGASRNHSLPWSVQVSPWFHGSCTTSGPLRREGGVTRGLDAGHSLSLYERMWLHGWFAGAAMVTPENSVAIFFEEPAEPWRLTEHGRKASEVFQFVNSHDRGVPFTPVAVVLDHLVGYNGYMGKPWGILDPTAGDRQIKDLFDFQLFPGSDHIHRRPDPENPENSYLRPTPHGEMFDVQLTSAGTATLTDYKVLLLAGDIEFDVAFCEKLNQVLQVGTRVLMKQSHHQVLRAKSPVLADRKGIEILEPWVNPASGREAAISDRRLEQLAREVLPLGISGSPIQFQINRNKAGWVIELINNAGVTKTPHAAAVTDPSAVALVRLKPRFGWRSAREWKSNRRLEPDRSGQLQLVVGPGQTAFVEFSER